MKKHASKYTNQLIHESSPYLLQHAHNPVDWLPWNEEALIKAKQQDKPILISIGYSACHWCHVMERESFEDDNIAAYMNEHFICIKVDREERPDLDHVYMEAVQMLTGQGGWPLNMFLTPDAKPFYGGTYFPPRPAHGRPSWEQVLSGVLNSFNSNRKAIEEQAQKITDYIGRSDKSFLKESKISFVENEQDEFHSTLQNHFNNCKRYFDNTYGGFGEAPKFPHFYNIIFLLQYAFHSKNSEAQKHALFSINKMIDGGIYDQIGGGISRYSTDSYWLAPHFEKMLYDNALLIETLTEAFAITQDEIYANKIVQTVTFLQREMLSDEGGFYAALDADSEGEEGKFYVWSKREIEQVLKEDTDLFCEFFDVTESGNWEHQNILNQKIRFEEFAEKKKMSLHQLREKINSCNEKLLTVRLKRIAPGIDDKILLGWNAMTCGALTKAFKYTQQTLYKELAIKNIEFLIENFINSSESDFSVFHTYKNGKAKQTAFIDDVALFILALIEIYQITFDTKYLYKAKQLTDYAIDEFYNLDESLFYFSAKSQKDIVIRKAELNDSVTPSGNSVMAHVLSKLAVIFDNNEYRRISNSTISIVITSIEKHPLSFGNWAIFLLEKVFTAKEIAIVGKDYETYAFKVMQHYFPSAIIVAAEKEIEGFPLLANRNQDNKTAIYLCENNSCYPAVYSADEFIAEINQRNN